MRIERVDDKTIKCFLSNEELAQYEIDYKDFVMRSDKAREVVQDIMTQAREEVGYQPPKYAFDLQIMMIPDQGMLLTFQDKDLTDLKNNDFLMDCLKEMQRMLQQAGGSKKKSEAPAPKSDQGQKADPGQKEPAQPDFAVFAFRNIGRVMEYASVLPKNLRVKSALYAMDGLYYLHMQKGGASYERYSRACVQALEFAGLFAAAEDRLDYLREHGECLIEEQALKKLRTN